MTRPGPALRVALLGVAAAVVGFALLAAWLGAHAYAYHSARERAVATSDGLVIEDGIGSDGDIRVRWTDSAGHAHVQRFGVYATGRYAKGHRFPVAYDPGQAHPRGFAADPDETSAQDDLLVPIGLAGVVAAVVCGVWARRGLRFRRAARRPGRAMTAAVLSGERPGGGFWPSGTIWLALSEVSRPDQPVRWQRVMWHPALDGLSEPAAVTVRGAGGRGPGVAELPDGTRLVPLGRLHHRPPRRIRFSDRRDVRGDLRDAFVLPAGTEGLPARPWWRPGLTVAALGALAGGAASLLFTGGSVVAAGGFGVIGAALLLSAWALAAPQP